MINNKKVIEDPLAELSNLFEPLEPYLKILAEVNKFNNYSFKIAFSGYGKDFSEIILSRLSDLPIIPAKKYKDIYPPGFLISSLHHAHINNLQIELIRNLDRNINAAFNFFEELKDHKSIDLLNLVLKENADFLLGIMESLFEDTSIVNKVIEAKFIGNYSLINKDVIYKPFNFINQLKGGSKNNTGLDITSISLSSSSVLSLILTEIIECVKGGLRVKRCEKCSAYLFSSDKTSHCPYCSSKETNKQAALRMQIKRLIERGYSNPQILSKTKDYMEKRGFEQNEIEYKIQEIMEDMRRKEESSRRDPKWSEMSSLFSVQKKGSKR